MKVKTLRDGHDGRASYAAGDTLDDSDHARTLLASGLADPADAEAEEAALNPAFVERHAKAAYAAQLEPAEVAGGAITPARARRLKLVSKALAKTE